FALLFDCDGVIVETEELHRLAYNAAFDAFQLRLGDAPVVWDVEYYDKLQNTVGGGKPKMQHYFNTERGAWPTYTPPLGEGMQAPESAEARGLLVDQLQDAKTEFYKSLLDEVAQPRPGVLRLMDQALADPDLKVGICSAATRAGFEKVVDTLVGQERLSLMDVIIAGDDVTDKKPHPMIYLKAASTLGLQASQCVVVEDSLVGLRAA
ncbi:HAD-like domain-containing protein, partial [Ochromonadaceae sp. CCMP2298]